MLNLRIRSPTPIRPRQKGVPQPDGTLAVIEPIKSGRSDCLFGILVSDQKTPFGVRQTCNEKAPKYRFLPPVRFRFVVPRSLDPSRRHTRHQNQCCASGLAGSAHCSVRSERLSFPLRSSPVDLKSNVRLNAFGGHGLAIRSISWSKCSGNAKADLSSVHT